MNVEPEMTAAKKRARKRHSEIIEAKKQESIENTKPLQAPPKKSNNKV